MEYLRSRVERLLPYTTRSHYHNGVIAAVRTGRVGTSGGEKRVAGSLATRLCRAEICVRREFGTSPEEADSHNMIPHQAVDSFLPFSTFSKLHLPVAVKIFEVSSVKISELYQAQRALKSPAYAV
ncbi:hypothetical protein PoB_003512700 [Plakobranchus ocellatus]|uniref:Uncharacterized protein n=1 Tax=Plakobranchus ocellatus TaxID=259542 RepID=A0AAV4ANY1_9GAST|nr:hypothetical protein PoB_003512700 [Plakobranchus ocellatus]